MPPKKIHKPKTRAYLNTLLDNAGLSDKDMAKAIKEGITSGNPSERSKALDMAAQWKGFADVDKRAGDDIEALPLANVKMEDLDRLANRCSYCKHKKFEPIRGGKPAEPASKSGFELGTAIAVIDPVATVTTEETPAIPVDEPPLSIPGEMNEQNPQEKAD